MVLIALILIGCGTVLRWQGESLAREQYFKDIYEECKGKMIANGTWVEFDDGK